MSFESFRLGALCALLVAVGALAWRLALAPPLRADASPLATLPLEIAGWRGQEIPVEAAVERVLRAEFNLQRAYLHPSGELVWVYLGYYGTARGGRPEHTPRGCYTGAGWRILETRRLAASAHSPLRVNEFLVERDGEQQLVEYWYRSYRRTGLLGGFDQNLDRLLGRLLEGRADGALLRVSAPVRDGDEVGARGRLLAFAEQLDSLVAERWPQEHPAAEPAPDSWGTGRSARAAPFARLRLAERPSRLR